jgi:hypothetical protein
MLARETLFQNRRNATGKNAHPTAVGGWAFLPNRGFETASEDYVAFHWDTTA